MLTLSKALKKATPLLLLMAIAGCEPAPEPIRYGEDGCAHCRMLIMDQKYGSELVSQKGKVYKFDSIECLVAFYISENTLAKTDVHSLWITPFDQPEALIDAKNAAYLHSAELPSPMGLNLSGFTSDEAALEMRVRFNGEILTWADLFPLVQGAWLNKQ